jgi:putative transcriptional regulator
MKTKISELRKKLGITQEELAEKVGVTRQTIISLEAGRYNPSLLLAYKITQALGQKRIEEVFEMR